MNLADLLIEHPFADDEPLLHDFDHSVTAGDARRSARNLAARLRDAGVQPGQAVGVQLPNGPDVVVAMAAIWLAGAVLVPVNPRFPKTEVAKIVSAVRPRALVRSDGIEVLAGDARRYAPGTGFVLWTSGTTGDPKPILHTHSAYIELLDRVLAPLRSRPRDPGRPPTPNLIPVSLALNAGIYNALFGLRAGAALVIMDGFDTTTFAELIHRFEIRSTVLPPAAIAMLADDESITDLAPLRYVRSITAPLSPFQARRFTDRFGAFVLNGYGQAEIGEVIGWTAADAKEHPNKLGAIGKPHAGVDIMIADDGELLVRPPRMAAGYATGDDLADRVDDSGFVHTGDIARVDADGFVWIEGRVGDLINRGGNKVFPDQVEEVLRLSPEVRDAAVVGVSDTRLGEVPVAFVVGDACDTPALDALCRKHLAAYKVPVAFSNVDELPRNEVGKILRSELAARHQRHEEEAR